MVRDIDIFLYILRPLIGAGHVNAENVVISGANAIKAHGLILNREAADLDVAVYQPTQEQLEIIHKGEPAMTAGAYPEQRVFKFFSMDTSMDIVVEPIETPPNLLYHAHYVGDDMLFFKVQSIENCIAAKRFYNREKDWRDFQDLKNSNFNMSQPDKIYAF